MLADVINDVVRIDRENATFKIARRAFVDPDILAAERAAIFDTCWLYLGHESELRKPGDFVTRSVGGRTIIFSRDTKGQLRALMNTCPHRGARVCRERSGNAKSFQCFYHGWIFGIDGQLRNLPGEESYPPGFAALPSSSLQPAPRFESFRGFNFVCFDPNAVSLVDYLGNAAEYLELVADQSEAGMEIVGGTQEYSIRANWKLLAENSYDGYHATTNHATYFDYLKGTTGGLVPIKLEGSAKDLGNGHGAIEYSAPFARPIAQWIEAWGPDGKERIDAIYRNLVDRFGEDRAKRIALLNRNIHIFPNLSINDIMALTVRTYYPVEPNFVTVNAWALAPIGEDSADRNARLANFLEFLGPGGFATPDDVEALEQCQAGYANRAEVRWNDISRGFGRPDPSYDDEAQMRGYWTEWNRRVAGVRP